MGWEKEIKGKRWIMRWASKEEQNWMFEMVKKYHESTCKWKVIEWNHSDGKLGIEFHKTGFTWNIRGQGLFLLDKPFPETEGLSYTVTRKELENYLKKNGIIIPNFAPAEYVYREDGKLLK